MKNKTLYLIITLLCVTLVSGATYIANSYINVDTINGDTGTTVTVDDTLNVSNGLNVIDGNITGNLIHGEMWNYSSNATAWSFSMGSVDVYYNLTGLEEGELNGFTHTSNNQQNGGSTLTVHVDGIYQVKAAVSTELSGQSGIYSFAVVKNHDVSSDRSCYARRTVSNGNVGSISMTCIMDLSAGDLISIQIEDEANPANGLEIHTANLNLVRIGET